MLTLEEVIKAEEAETLAYEECLNSLDDNMPTDMRNEFNKSLGKQMDYHRQLAEWLRELKELRKFIPNRVHPSCAECIHMKEEFAKQPCRNCCNNYISRFEREVNADGKKEDT